MQGGGLPPVAVKQEPRSPHSAAADSGTGEPEFGPEGERRGNPPPGVPLQAGQSSHRVMAVRVKQETCSDSSSAAVAEVQPLQSDLVEDRCRRDSHQRDTELCGEGTDRLSSADGLGREEDQNQGEQSGFAVEGEAGYPADEEDFKIEINVDCEEQSDLGVRQGSNKPIPEEMCGMELNSNPTRQAERDANLEAVCDTENFHPGGYGTATETSAVSYRSAPPTYLLLPTSFLVLNGRSGEVGGCPARPAAETEKHACPVCSREFSLQSSLRRHERTVHNTGQQFPCDLCEEMFPERFILQSHMKTVHCVENRFACTICGKLMTRKNHLKSHVLSVHFKEKLHFCHLCGLPFSGRGSLKIHVLSIHHAEKNHVCGKCGKRFATNSRLKMHHVTVHEQHRPFVCHVCQKRFGMHTHLARHVKSVHWGERGHQCLLCLKAYPDKATLKRHQETVHADLRRFACDHCSAAFKYKVSLDRHTLRDHFALLPQTCSSGSSSAPRPCPPSRRRGRPPRNSSHPTHSRPLSRPHSRPLSRPHSHPHSHPTHSRPLSCYHQTWRRDSSLGAGDSGNDKEDVENVDHGTPVKKECQVKEEEHLGEAGSEEGKTMRRSLRKTKGRNRFLEF